MFLVLLKCNIHRSICISEKGSHVYDPMVMIKGNNHSNWIDPSRFCLSLWHGTFITFNHSLRLFCIGNILIWLRIHIYTIQLQSYSCESLIFSMARLETGTCCPSFKFTPFVLIDCVKIFYNHNGVNITQA